MRIALLLGVFAAASSWVGESKDRAAAIKSGYRLHTGLFFTAQVPEAWTNPFPEAADASIVVADFGGMSGRINFHRARLRERPPEKELALHVSKMQRATLDKAPIRIKSGSLFGYQSTGIMTMLKGEMGGKPRGFMKAVLADGKNLYTIQGDCPAADLGRWRNKFQRAVNTFRPR